MSQKSSSRKQADKDLRKPTGNAVAIFWRLFHQYALRHWFRLFLGLFFALLMGGAMHGFLRFLDIGVMTLELGGSSDKTKTEQVQDGAEHKHENPIQKVLKNRLLQWTIQKLGIQQTLEKKEKHAKAEGEPTPDSESKDVSKFEKKVSKLTGKLGLEMNGSETLTLPVVCVIVVLLMFFFMIKAVSEFINKYFLRWVGARVVTDMREDLFRNFQQQSLRFFSQNDVGQLISRCTNDTALVDHAFSNSIAEMVLAPIQIIVALDFILRKALEVGLVKPTLLMCLVAPFCLVPVYVVSKYIRTYQHKVLRRIALLVAAMQENLNGIRVVKAFNREEFENERFRKQNNHYFRAVVKAVLADVFMGPTMQLTAIGIGIVFIILCYHYQISLGVLFSLGYAAQTAYRPLKELAKMNTNLQKCAAAAERIFNMLDVSSHLPEPENPEPKTAFNDSIRFENVTFAYEKEQGNVLQNFSLEIKKGQHVAIVGATGSGKSTTANLLARFYDPDQGSITIDGRDLRSISNHDLRSLIGIVAQDNFLFNETIAYNILYGRPEASEEELHDAAQRANAADFIEADPLGYNRPCGERGCLLSGGQKQRIAIARALLKNPPILILDEATSALDTITEQLVQQAIDQLKQDRTVLSIAHRLSTIVHSDNIVVLENGHIVEQGTHQELYALNGKYKDLYDRQVSGNDPLP